MTGAEQESISIRAVQHFLYCPHRWGLIEIEHAWAENIFVVKANFMHERAHKTDRYRSRAKTVYTGVSVWNDEYGLYGVLDCLEKTAEGCYTVVEYKPSACKEGPFRKEDAMQIFAQKLCADAVFGCDCEAAVFYGDTKRRVTIPMAELREEYDALLRSALLQMRSCLQSGTVPQVRSGQYCGGCSMKDLCMPYLKQKGEVRKQIALLLEETL